MVTDSSRATDFKAMKMPETQPHRAESPCALLVSHPWSPQAPYLCQEWAEDVQGLTPQMGQLPQRNSVHRVRIFILFVHLAKRENPKVSMSEDQKANATVHWGARWGFSKCYSFIPPGQFHVRAGTGALRRLNPWVGGSGVTIKAAEAELKSRPGSRPVLFPQAHWW